MASYREHLAFSTALGGVYGCIGMWGFGLDWGTAILAAGITALGGLMPDLDSDSGVPVRELFGIAAAVLAIFTVFALRNVFPDHLDRQLAAGATVYLLVRYWLSGLFKKTTSHRGMYHSIPAMFIAGGLIYLLYRSPDHASRVFVAIGAMVGFLSHLVLDEIYAVDFMGGKITRNQFSGTALKLWWKKSYWATVSTYALLAIVGLLCLL